MQELLQRYEADPRVDELLRIWDSGRGGVMGSVHGAFAALLLACLWRQLADKPEVRPNLLVCGDPEQLVDDLDELGVPVAILPEMDEFEHESGDEDVDRRTQARRVAALERHLHKGSLLVATPHAVDQPIPQLHNVIDRSLRVQIGDEWDIGALAERLVDEGYHVASTVEKPGQLAIRGGILDVHPLATDHPFRIEFFGDEIETIRLFDSFTQESIRAVDEARLTTRSGIVADAELWKELPERPILVLGDLPLSQRLRTPHGRIELRLARRLEQEAYEGATVTVERFKGDLRRNLEAMQEADADSELLCLVRNDEAGEELRAHLDDHDIDAVLIVGRLQNGFRDMDQGRVVVHDFELAHRLPSRKRQKKIAGGMPLASLTDLKHGDYVVHVNHGIAKFRGMATLEKRGYLEDFLLLEFAEEAKIYLPVAAIDLVQKYIGGAGRHPDLSKLGGTTWKKRRAKAEKAVEDLAAELLATQAARQAAGGIRFDADDPNIRRFETSFPFEETEDQLVAAREIKSDMQADRSMERLLCGDVGFGKTEVAMRAAFKAVHSGYQVAVLAPTTLLAEQHAATFAERFSGSGARIECLNRFRSGAERTAIIAATRLGEVDVLIGTHALFSQEVAWHRLGLLIVDEEHRFGVKHKETLKRARAGVDVLTMSATPIPRTLHFSLSGLRDISVLAEAPSSRLAVMTRVAPWDKDLIRGAIERELAREGQIFFIHNRVKDIDAVARRLERLVPDMRLGIIHGQMPEKRIADTMLHFQHGGIDCLLSTSIVESGIDIPNANTLFINNAHCFGLSELHQLRGRIGRFTRQAYAYFLIPPDKPLTGEARERLDAIQEYSDLGAGFKLAMRDLEIRGAGNLLGAEQSGHMDAIGYELYCRLLADAVRRQGAASGQRATIGPNLPGTEGEATLAFPVDAYVPDDYIDNSSLKFEVHKALENARQHPELRQAVKLVRDRFGPLPEPVQRLIRMRAIRIQCRIHEISRIEVRDRQVRLHLLGALPETFAQVQLPELLHIQLDDQVLILFTRLRLDDPDTVLGFLCRLLRLDSARLLPEDLIQGLVKAELSESSPGKT